MKFKIYKRPQTRFESFIRKILFKFKSKTRYQKELLTKVQTAANAIHKANLAKADYMLEEDYLKFQSTINENRS